MQETHDAHPIHIAAHESRVRVLFEGHEIADSDDALVLSEQGHDPVFYFPREDVQFTSFRRNDHVTHCPHKGAATHFTLMRDGHVIENAAWSYEDPLEGCELIKDRIAFYPEHFDFHVDGGRAKRHVPAHDPPYADTTDARDV